MVENACVGNDRRRRHFLAVDVFMYGFGGVLFQLDEEAEKDLVVTRMAKFPKGKEKVIHFISQRFHNAETCYLLMEREALVVIRCLEEVRWMVVTSGTPVIVFTCQPALLGMLRGDDVRGRMAGWQMRLAEYDLELRNVKVAQLELATGLSRMPYEIMDPPAPNPELGEASTSTDPTENHQRVQVDEVEDEYQINARQKKGRMQCKVGS